MLHHMDPEDAVLLLSEGISPDLSSEALLPELEKHGEALAYATRIPEGLNGLVWQSGIALMTAAASTDLGADGFYERFGWPTLSSAMEFGLGSQRVLDAVALASEPFVPAKQAAKVFEHPLVLDGIARGLLVNPRPFVRPGELAAAAQTTQNEFVRLLSALAKMGADLELRMQWSACCLRVLSVNPEAHRNSAVHFLQALMDDQRFIMAYYAFRALADQHPSLWEKSQAVQSLGAFIQSCVGKNAFGIDELVRLASDEELMMRCIGNIGLSAVIGATGCYLVREQRRDEGLVPMWSFINQLQDDFPRLAAAWTGFASQGMLPTLPTTYAGQIRHLRSELHEAIEAARTELRARQYDQLPLAIQIYQHNVKEVFLPLIEAVESGKRPKLVLEQIRHEDPTGLVTDNELQRANRFPIEGKMLRKMISDNRRILQCLETAATIQGELQSTLTKLSSEPRDRYDVFDEFVLFAEEIGQTAVMAVRQLLPTLWQCLQAGVDTMNAEREEAYAVETGQ